ncbi:MAG: cytochrome c peroxidase [Planctomycetota bacterium]
MSHLRTKLLLGATVVLVLAGSGVVSFLGYAQAQKPTPSAFRVRPKIQVSEYADRQQYIRPIPLPPELDAGLVDLGRRLFRDTRLSSTGEVSCASCHDIENGGDDGLALSVGVSGEKGTRNSPTVLNSVFNFRQFWDGRAKTLEEQVDGPLEHPDEMGLTWEQVLEVVQGDPDYVSDFQKATGEGPTADSVRVAIATFERSLTTPGSPFDRYLMGDDQAIDAQVLRGYEAFVDVGCVSCHQGVGVGGNMMQPLGRMRRYFADKAPTDGTDEDALYKVPSLRNVVRTAPYLHDGSIKTLPEAVRLMGKYQLGIELAEEEITDIVAFLGSLDCDLPASE